AQARRNRAPRRRRRLARMLACLYRPSRGKRTVHGSACRNPRRGMSAEITATAQTPPLVPVLAVVGVGLIGGSFAAALRSHGAVGRVLGVGRHAATLAQAKGLGLIDEIASIEQAAEQADIIFLATP